MNLEAIARVAHEAIKVWCEENNDFSQPHWEQAPDWQKESAVKGVKFRLANPSAAQSAIHDNWMKDKIKDGWKLGKRKDAEKKTHPCLVPYQALSQNQIDKDYIFCAVVDSLIKL